MSKCYDEMPTDRVIADLQLDRDMFKAHFEKAEQFRVSLQADRADLIACLREWVDDDECGDGFRAMTDEHNCYECDLMRRTNLLLARLDKA